MRYNKQAFARAIAMFAAIAAAIQLPEGQRQVALGKIAPYKSRGKGRGTPERNYGNTCRNTPHEGKAEVARRLRQIEKGQLTASNGLVLS